MQNMISLKELLKLTKNKAKSLFVHYYAPEEQGRLSSLFFLLKHNENIYLVDPSKFTALFNSKDIVTLGVLSTDTLKALIKQKYKHCYFCNSLNFEPISFSDLKLCKDKESVLESPVYNLV